MVCVVEIKAQDWQCNPAVSNTCINSNVYLSENSVAVNPLKPNIVLSANNYDYYGIGGGGVSAYISTDWGVTWISALPNNGVFENSQADPAACIGLNGYMYVSYLFSGGIKVARSIDNGDNWTIFTVFSGDSDKEHLHIDNSCNSLFEGRIYCAWTGSQTKITYSTNSGKTWSSPPVPPVIYRGVNITTDNSGTVYIVSAIYSGPTDWQQIQLKRSTDGGVTWITPVQNTINLDYPAGGGNGVGPSMTVNMQDGTLYLVYPGYTGVPNGEDVFMKKSTDHGDTWSGQSRVNQNPAGNQTFPWISCDPMTGYLACIYYDTRSGNNTYLSISTDNGNNWCDMKINVQPVGIGGATGNDYIGVEFNKGIVYPVWSTGSFGQWRTYTYPFDVIAKDLIVQNQYYTENKLIQSAKTITASDVTINSGVSVSFRTVNSITLLPGFYTNDNSYFSAELFHCEGYNEPENISLNNYTESKKTDKSIPLEYSLSQNYPNPFNPVTSIKYSLKYDSWVNIIIYNILGQEVKRLVDGYGFAGFNSVNWDGTNKYGMQVSSGIYFYKLTVHEVSGSSTVDFTDQKKMVIIR